MIETIITSSVLIMVVITVRFFIRGKISRRLQYALWGLVLLRLLMPFPLVDSQFSIMNWTEIGEGPVITYLAADSAELPDLAPVEPGPGAADADYAAAREGYEREMEKARAAAGTPLTVAGMLSIVWLPGGIAVALWFLGANYVFYRRLKRMRKAYEVPGFRLPVYLADNLPSPCLFGLFRPAVYLTPKAAAFPETVRHVLSHEYCHYVHGDHIWSLLRGVCLSLYWFDPLVWAAAILSRIDCELACDEAAVKRLDEDSRLAYGRALIDMIAVKSAPSGLMSAATTMNSGKRGIKERLNLIIRNPKTFVPALTAVLLIISVCAVCTFTGADKGAQEQDKPEVNMVFSSKSTDLEQLGRDAASSYYSQFMGDDVPGYWHITKYETLSCKLEAGDEKEFAVWLTSYIETDGAGFLIGQGIPYDPGDISKGGICPEVGREIRVKTLGGGEYEIVSIGTGGGAQGLTPAEGMVNIDRTDLEACVSDAILTENADLNQRGDFACEAHTVLKAVEKGNLTTVYLMALYMEFDYAAGGFSQAGGSHMPVAVTFEKDDAGEYELIEYWTPQDGSYYGPSIEAKFPSDIGMDAIDTQKYITAHMQSCYAQAIEYGRINTDAALAWLVETICSSPAQMSNPKAYIDEHPIEYREMIYYGSYTLRYCFNLFEQGGQTGLDGHIMASACRDILGGEDISVLAATGQEWYDAFKTDAQNLRRQNGDDYIAENKPGTFLLLQLLDDAAISPQGSRQSH